MAPDSDPCVDRNDALAELLARPVGRRFILKATGGAVLSLAGATGGALALDRLVEPPLAEAGPRHDHEVRTLHFALGALPGVTDLELVVSGTRLPLQPHTNASRKALHRRKGLWEKLDLTTLSHFVPDVSLPARRGLLVSIHGQRGDQAVLVAQTWHAPRHAVERAARAAIQATGSLVTAVGSPARLSRLGTTPEAFSKPSEVADLDAVVDATQTAIALCMCHPNVSTIDPTLVAATKALLLGTPEIDTLGTYIDTMQNQKGEDWATLPTVTDADGQPSQIKIGDTTTTFKTVVLNQTDATFQQNAGNAIAASIVGVRDTATLGAVITGPLETQPAASTKTWVQTEGLIPTASPLARGRRGNALTVALKHPGTQFGTHMKVGALQDGAWPVTIYNNYVRWLGVYVQYLDVQGNNLSIDPGASYPDTKYSKFLKLMPQVFTILGVPLWDTNSTTVTIQFPPGAVTARLLLGGLGGDVYGQGWRQYFPASAYPGLLSPQDEVVGGALITGFLTLGLTIVSLVTDTATVGTFQTLRNLEAPEDLIQDMIKQIAGDVGLFTGIERIAAALAMGTATVTQLDENGFTLTAFFKAFAGMATLLVKVLFSPGVILSLGAVTTELIAEEGVARVTDAVPIVGEVLAALALAGDLATLGEIVGETIRCPWVIENEVSVTYQATVTISHDPQNSHFPVTARNWRLEYVIDEASQATGVTGSINPNPNQPQSSPIVQTLAVPFGGTVIQWSIVFTDVNGHQVGTGSSGKLANDDPAHPPTAVTFAIKEIPVPITAATRFVRAATTTYDSFLGGYQWSPQVVDQGTRLQGGIEEVAGVTVSTLSGMAGYVWKQKDKYYLRNLPTVEGDALITLQPSQTEGYARRPFLLYDSFVEPGAEGNHFLLEPDDATDGYHARRLTLDVAAARFTWDPAVSSGYFPVPISAAALHASGSIVVVHTNSGRIGLLAPYAVNVGVGARPQLATYKGGPGTQPGLMQSPVAVVVTNPGVVLALEAEGNQVAAFDLQGDPIRYFKTGYRLPLVSAGIALDLGVDGSNQLYVLYYVGDGSTTADYRLDVYAPDGTPILTGSPGVNVAHLAVDYWRSVFGANFGPLTSLGTPWIDPALGVAEPALSRFDPQSPTGRARS